MVSPAGPQLPKEPARGEHQKSKPASSKGVNKIILPKASEEHKQTMEQKVSLPPKETGKEIGFIWSRFVGKAEESSDIKSQQKAYREEIRMARLKDLAGTKDELAIDLLKECQRGRINADQAVIILGTIQQHNERVEGIIGHALTPKQKQESYGQLFSELKKLSKNPQMQTAIDALIRKHAIK